MDVARVLRDAREARGTGLEELSARSRYPTEVLEAYEAGARAPSLLGVRRILSILGTTSPVDVTGLAPATTDDDDRVSGVLLAEALDRCETPPKPDKPMFPVGILRQRR